MTRKLIALVAALLFVVAACGDDDGGATTTEGGVTTTTQGEMTTTSDGMTTTSGGEMPTATTGDGAVDADVQALLEGFSQARVRATYAVNGDEMILSQDPPRSAWLFPDGGKMVIQEGGSVVFCGADGTCFESPTLEGPQMTQMMTAAFMNPFFFGLVLGEEEVAALPGFEVAETSATIAGREATCFTFDPEAVGGVEAEAFRQCVDNETGLTLLLEGEDPGGSGTETFLEVVEVGEPLEEDFEITGEVTELPSG